MKRESNPIEPQFAALIGLDWGDAEHALAFQDVASGKIETSTLKHSAESIRAWLNILAERFKGRPVAIALETSKGPLIHMLFDVPWLTVYPIHPATSTRMRKAFAPSGAKDDIPDARVLLDLLANHRHKLRPLLSEDAATRRLAGLCELRRRAVDHRTGLTNQLRSALKSYFPQALELLGERLDSPMALDFLRRWPDLISLKSARAATLKSFYGRHNVRRLEAIQERLELIRQAQALTTDEVIVALNVRQVERLIQQIEVLQEHIAEDERLIQEAFRQHPEAELFRDLPGAGKILAPRLLVAFGSDRSRYDSACQLQRYCGVAPVKEKSCGRIWVHWRWNAPWFLRQTFIEWAGLTVVYSSWAKAYYEKQKSRGKRHWAILRSLAFIWIRILWKCWQQRTPYNETTYLEALRKHHSTLVA